MTHTRHPLHPSCLAQLAARAVAVQGEYGAVTDLADVYGVRRQRVHELRNEALVVLEEAFDESPASQLLSVTDASMKRATVALRVVTPASVRDIQEVLPVLFGVRWSYGKVWNVIHQAERRAAEWLGELDLSGIETVALDEMFSQRRPVLAGIDLDTQYLFQLDVRSGRSGEDWAASLKPLRDVQNLRPDHVVKDAGTGLRAGVEEVWPGIEERDDLFHALYLMGQTARRLENAGYRHIGAEVKLMKKRARASTETERRSLGQRLRRVRERMAQALDRHDRFEKLTRRAEAVLQLTDRGSGCLRTSAEVVRVLTAVAEDMVDIGGKQIRKVATYIRGRAAGLGRYLDHLGARLREVAPQVGGETVVQAIVRSYQASLLAARNGPRWDRKARQHELREAVDALLHVTDHDLADLRDAMALVLPELADRHRASSAIENLNSVLRPYLVVQKHAEQGFLDLFRFYWNTRERRWGRGKGTSPFEALTGRRVDDWLTLLGYPPDEALAQAA